MGKVFVNVGMTLDGYIGPEEVADDRNGRRWWSQWMELHGWVFEQSFFRENLRLGEGGRTGQDNARLEATFQRTGASVMGKRMFDAGETGWPEEAPFHTPVFVLTHEKREPWERPGGTVFHFVDDGIESALQQARNAADDKDIRIAGGADVIRQYLNAGLVEELEIALAPTLFGSGIALFAGVERDRLTLEVAEAVYSPQVTHLRYSVRSRQPAA